MQLDAGAITTIYGVVTMRRRTATQMVTAYEVDVKSAEEDPWTPVDAAGSSPSPTFTGNVASDGDDDQAEGYFAVPQEARYVRIRPTEAVGYP